MTFQKGQIANPTGVKYKRQWIAEKQRIAAARKAWDKLNRLIDDLVLERKEIKGDNGETMQIDVVASVKDYISCCKEMNRSVGTPRTEGESSSDVDKGVLFIDFMRSLIGYLSSKDPQALEYLEFHLRGFAQEVKDGVLLPGPHERRQ